MAHRAIWRITGGDLHGLGVCGIGKSNLGRFGLAPSVPDRACPPLLRRLPWRLAHPSVSGQVLGQPHEVGETPTRFRRKPGQPRSPPYYLIHRTAPGSSSCFCSSNFWSTTTTFVGSPPLPRNEITGHGHQIVVVRGARINTTVCL